ncbi:two-component regulator propeller domain-containing protein [Flavobacterium sp. NG2]|uniref:hybrid sensor histidine kinase/response regulator transcription factor n=1 Tax=Flavobacterium sp. NG2 TaxID=3097547 RepID=UPI002A8078BB|nr:two-component regulator propeller domain-containing protein [Flavobacterium sp. NG2]WPR73160.1 two-component regulator propeller domain-containing protein [Flavobacterium sp. NG2]
MKSKLIYLFLFFVISLCDAQEKNFFQSNQRVESFNSIQGFYQNTISSIVSDSKGYLWIATPNGLVKYDGYSFDYYYHNHKDKASLPNNYVSHLLNDSSGRLWIGTKEGLCVYLTDKEHFVFVKNTIKKETFIKEDRQKRIWVGNDSGLTIYDSGSDNLEDIDKLAEINLGIVFKGSPIADIEFLSSTELLVATAFKIYKVTFNDKANYSVKVSELKFDLDSSKIKKIKKAGNSIWIGTTAGLYQTFYENNKLITLAKYLDTNQENGNRKCEIISLYFDKDKNLWIGTKQNGVFKYDTKKEIFAAFRYDSKYKNGLTSNRVNCFYEDAFGVIWIGTAQGGLNKFDKNQKPFQNFAHNPYDNQSLSSNLITDITEDNKGRIWFSFFESSICRTQEKLNLNSGNQIRFDRLQNELSKLKNQWVLRLFQDLKGYWWISTNEGLYLFDEASNKLVPVRLTVNGKTVDNVFNRVIQQIDSNQIILGGAHVLLLNNPWAAILNNLPVEVNGSLYNLIKDSQINDFVKDSLGNYWFATTNGLFRIINRKGQWIMKNHLTTSSKNNQLKLSHNHIFSIHVSPNKKVWLGTFGGGLMKIDLNSFGEPQVLKSYHREDGLRDEAVYGILEDSQGQLWLSTDMGICCFNPAKETFNFYDVNNGILSNNFRQSAFLKTKNGTILMGGVDGLTIFDPKQIKKNGFAPKVLISRLKINNQPVVAGKKIDNDVILEQSISDTKKLVIGHNNRNISLDIIVQHSATPNKNRIAYKLEGVNKDWIEVDGGKTTATYTNLSPGTYKFLYKGTNGDGVWTANIEDFTIKVLAPWYLRWWSVTLWLLLIGCAIYAVFKYLVQLEKLNQELKFEQLDKSRVQEMNQARLRFFTNISHDFKTPLSLIIGPLEKIAEKNESLENQKYFSIINNNISRLQRLIDQLISYRKAETGNLELNYSKTTLGDFIYPLIESFEEYGQKTLLNFYYKVDEPNKVISLDIDKTERIILNLFSNAVKYSDSNREVSIEAGFIKNQASAEESLFIQVTNTSLGIPPDKIEKIFDRFYRGVDEKNDWNGTGIGLALCKSLTDLMEGTITVTSDPDKKTVFRITLPITDKGEYVREDDMNKYLKIATDWLPIELDEIPDHQNQLLDKSRPTILVVDDEQDIRSFLFEAFKNDYNVVLAVDGEDGLKKLNENPPHLVISDVMMPKLNGYELCEEIKSNLEFCHIPIILLTAIGDDVKKIEGLELGADDYIVKPFSIKYLEVRVKKLLENKQRVLEYYSRNSFLPKESLISSVKDQHFLEKINIAIEKNMSNSAFGVEELAAEICMSTSHFYRKLKELTGQAPNVYLRNFRIQKAAELLSENKKLTAAEIMYEIGIESKSYFSSAFKKIHGVSPSEFIKK